MFVSRIFGFLGLYAGAVLAKPLQIVNEDTLSPSLPNIDDSVFTSNVSNSTLTLGPFANFNLHCDGTRYGFNLNIIDCERAARAIIPDSEQLIWADRHARGAPSGFFPLPFVIFGDSAECMASTIIYGEGPTARASLTQVRNAAAALSLSCSAGSVSQGGIATNIGGDNNLAVTLSNYEPNLRCGRQDDFTDASLCGTILGEMPASKEKMLFGPGHLPGVQEQLPQLFTDGDTKCFLRLYSATGRADYATWYSIWEAAEATFARCSRHKRSGSSRGLGENGEILMTLTGLPPAGWLGNSSQRASA